MLGREFRIRKCRNHLACLSLHHPWHATASHEGINFLTPPTSQFAGISRRLSTDTWHKLQAAAALASLQGAGANISVTLPVGLLLLLHRMPMPPPLHTQVVPLVYDSAHVPLLWSSRWESGQMERHKGRHMWWGVLERSSAPGLNVGLSIGDPHPYFISGLHCQQNCADVWHFQPHSLLEYHMPTAVCTAPSEEDKKERTWLCTLNLWNTRLSGWDFQV